MCMWCVCVHVCVHMYKGVHMHMYVCTFRSQRLMLNILLNSCLPYSFKSQLSHLSGLVTLFFKQQYHDGKFYMWTGLGYRAPRHLVKYYSVGGMWYGGGINKSTYLTIHIQFYIVDSTNHESKLFGAKCVVYNYDFSTLEVESGLWVWVHSGLHNQFKVSKILSQKRKYMWIFPCHHSLSSTIYQLFIYHIRYYK